MRRKKAFLSGRIANAEANLRATRTYLGSKEGASGMRSERTASRVNVSTGSLDSILLAVGSNERVLSRGMSWAEVNFRKTTPGTSLVVQWLRLCTPPAGDRGLILGQGTINRSYMLQLSSLATTKDPARQNKDPLCLD